MLKKVKKKLKLLLSKEEGKISKLSLGVGVGLFFSVELINAYSLNKQLFNINGDPTPKHIHQVDIKISENEPNNIEFQTQINNTCLIIGAVGGSGSCEASYWYDIIGGYTDTPSNSYVCNGDDISKTCRVRGNANDYGYVKYEWHNNDPNFDCSKYYGTFEVKVFTNARQRVNTWKNVI